MYKFVRESLAVVRSEEKVLQFCGSAVLQSCIYEIDLTESEGRVRVG
jgi:hypothetical protein